MSDDEWDTTDDLSSETTSKMLSRTEWLLAEFDEEKFPDEEKCPDCEIYKVMAESRLFAFPLGLKNHIAGWDDEFEQCRLIEDRNLLLDHPDIGSFYRMPPPKFPGGYNIPLNRIEKGSNRGCQFCGLLIDATTAWKKEQGVDGLVCNLDWALEYRDGRFLIEVRLHHDNNRKMRIFHSTGMSIIDYGRSDVEKT